MGGLNLNSGLKKGPGLLIFLLITSQSIGQVSPDSTVAGFMKNGKFSFRFRSFFMNTVNEGPAQDPAAWVIGSGLGYVSPRIKNFQFGFSGYWIQNIVSSDFTKPDPQTGIKNRYEVGLVDVMEPGRKTMLRLEELYLAYSFRKSRLVAGKQFLKTPFVNPEDGRMRPTMAEAVWADIPATDVWRFQGGWIWKMAPRSTNTWLGTGESIGIYSPGIDETGKPSAYSGNTHSSGTGILGITYNKNSWNLQAWNTYLENVVNTLFLQAEKKWSFANNRSLLAGIQVIPQHSSGNGGNADPGKRYYVKGASAIALSARIGYQVKNLETNLNYTRITARGRFLMPREWGREPFYTFMMRERNEGLGNVHALTLNGTYRSPNREWSFSAGYGQYFLPDVTIYTLNKYGMPSYQQLNIAANKKFEKLLNGLEIQVLLAFKSKTGNSYANPRYVVNKVNMINSNLVINYQF